MCGIVGMFNKEGVAIALVKGLKHLEYRGYDSAGMTVMEGKKLRTIKVKGRVSELEQRVAHMSGSAGIAHTRWATHGEPSERNAHPHISESFSVVHNGIIENHEELRDQLVGIEWQSETDTEVVLHLIEQEFKNLQGNTVQALIQVAQQIEGGSAIVLMSAAEENVIYAIRKSSPLVVGRNNQGEMMLASDSLAFRSDFGEGAVVPDNSVIRLKLNSAEAWNLNGDALVLEFTRIPTDFVNVALDGHAHFMHKEIHEQPQVVRRILKQHLSSDSQTPDESIGVTGLNLGKIDHIQIVGCGSAYHAGLLGKKYFELFTRVPITAELASEARYSDQAISAKTLLIAISQSGETADTLACAEKAVAAGCQVVAICNRQGSALARLASKTILLHCGPEVSVAATKSFTAMVICLYLFALSVGRNRGLVSKEAFKQSLESIGTLPKTIEEILRSENVLVRIAQKHAKSSSALFVGRRWNHPVAMEGALKLKEISYVHAEGLASGELKHGTLALVTNETPIIAISPRDAQFSKSMSNIREIAARGGRIIGFGERGDSELKKHCEDYFDLPSVREELSPVVSSVALQLLAYHTGLARGSDIDRPRNLAKSVTVE